MKRRDRTNRDLRTLLFTIADLHQRNGQPPTYRLLASVVGLSRTTVFYQTEALRKRGHLRPKDGTTHCLQLTDGPDFWRTSSARTRAPSQVQ